jgi:hypothetical protein
MQKFSAVKFVYFCMIVSLFFVCATVQAETLFEEDFEAPLSSSAQPKWSWKAAFHPDTNPYGMTYGKGDIYERSQTVTYTGSWSLRLNFEGRNGFCNTCGMETRTQKSGYSDTTYFVDSEGANLTLSPYDEPDLTRPVFNKSDFFAKWAPSSVSNGEATNDKLEFAGGSPVSNNLGGDGDFDAGDEIKICKKCGVDGSIGGDINRRSDCNLAINYLQNLAPEDHPAGGSIFRRFYFYMPSTTTMPNITIKLGYFTTAGGSLIANIFSPDANDTSGRGRQVEVDGMGYSGTGVHVEHDTWYYIEEEFERESSDSANDGEYRMWVCKASDEAPGDPKVEFTKLDLRQVKAISIIGNWPHMNDCAGYFYIDAVKIDTTRIGHITQGPNILPAPTNLKIVE